MTVSANLVAEVLLAMHSKFVLYPVCFRASSYSRFNFLSLIYRRAWVGVFDDCRIVVGPGLDILSVRLSV